MVPEIIPFEASDTFRIGIMAVVAVSFIPGRVPINAGIITTKLRGVIIL